MAAFTIPVEIYTNTDVAEVCLKIVQSYVNKTGRNIISETQIDGTLKLEFEKIKTSEDIHKMFDE